MADVYNPITREYKASVHTPDYPWPWVIVRDPIAGRAIEGEYRNDTDEQPRAMTRDERDAAEWARLRERDAVFAPLRDALAARDSLAAVRALADLLVRGWDT